MSRVHPSLANDNLSGIAVATFLARELHRRPLRYSYRFLVIPGTIGAITWLARNQSRVERIKHGLVLTCVGDPGAFHYKKSRQGNATSTVLWHWCFSASLQTTKSVTSLSATTNDSTVGEVLAVLALPLFFHGGAHGAGHDDSIDRIEPAVLAVARAECSRRTRGVVRGDRPGQAVDRRSAVLARHLRGGTFLARHDARGLLRSAATRRASVRPCRARGVS